ncbi:Ubiquitin carboxyl-terminal hydrolase 20, partial [Bonamia ostreae]
MALNKIIDNFIANPSNSREKRDSIVKDLFHGILIGQVECSRCNRVSQTRSQFSDLSLELPVAQEKSSFLGSIKKFFGDNLPPVTIEECLSHFCKTEGLDEDEMYFCRFCAKKVAAQKRFFFEKVPRTLVIQLKRFASKRHGHDGHGDMTKLRNHVAFPADDLDLSSYLFENKSGNGEGDGQNEAAKTKNTRYSLSSVVVHEGDGHSGNYISYCKNPVTGKWHQMNDRFTKAAKEEDVLSK